MKGIREECGVFGIYAQARYEIADTVSRGLLALQHRGQESCGIVVNDDGVFSGHKDLGLVDQVFPGEALARLGEGSIAVGHVRYGTTGLTDRRNAQPIVVNHIKGSMALAHNGNLVNSYDLRRELELQGSIFHTTSDTEVISYLVTKERLVTDSIEEAVCAAMGQIQGAFSLVIMSPSKLIAVRDPHGIRPLCYGKTQAGDYVVASESCALNAVSAQFIRDVLPGEIVVFEESGVRSLTQHCHTKPKTTCIFEYIYFARPDSVIDGVGVHGARVHAGALLARTHPVDADVVIGVPDSGLDAAIGYAREAGLPYEMGFVKNRYVGRTFISPGQKKREHMVDVKLNVIQPVVEGKRVVLIDDSVVRGTTAAGIVQKLRRAGAREVHLRLTAPPFLAPCFYGTDIPDDSKLIAANHTLEETCQIIGCDSIGYFDRERLGQLIGTDTKAGYCFACFGGAYTAGRPRVTEKYRFERKRSEGGT